VKVGPALVEQPSQRRDVLGEFVAAAGADRSTAPAQPDDAIVIEHRDAVGSQPDVALQPGRPELEGDMERLDGVLRRPVPGTAVGEANGRIEQRRQALLHDR
jgi:hypothetical protein